MAIRIRNRFHTDGRQRGPAELASVVAMLGWKLAIDALKRMREADYDIDIGPTYFEFVCEFMVFLAHAADRIAHARLDAEAREAFTISLVRRMADAIEDNRAMRVTELPPGESANALVARFNERGADYAECAYDADTGPDFGFRRVFAAGMQSLLPEKDRLWAIDQIMDIESPEAIKALKRTLDGLFAPVAPADGIPQRRAGQGVSGD